MSATPHIAPDLLSARVDDEVTTAERAMIDQHLATCAYCQDRLAALRQMKGALATLHVADDQVPGTFTLPERQCTAVSLPSVWVRYGLSAACLFCGLLLIGFSLFSLNGQTTTSVESAAQRAPSSYPAPQSNASTTGKGNETVVAASGDAAVTPTITPVVTLLPDTRLPVAPFPLVAVSLGIAGSALVLIAIILALRRRQA